MLMGRVDYEDVVPQIDLFVFLLLMEAGYGGVVGFMRYGGEVKTVLRCILLLVLSSFVCIFFFFCHTMDIATSDAPGKNITESLCIS